MATKAKERRLFRLADDKKKTLEAWLTDAEKNPKRTLPQPAVLMEWMTSDHILATDHEGTNWRNYTYFIWLEGRWQKVSIGVVEYQLSRFLRRLGGKVPGPGYTTELLHLWCSHEVKHQKFGWANSADEQPHGVTVFAVDRTVNVGRTRVTYAEPDPRNGNLVAVRHLVGEANGEPKKFLAWLDWFAQGDKGVVDLIQEMFGYALTPARLRPYVFFLYGEGRNGKSTLLNVLRATVGRKMCTAVSLANINDQTIESFEEALVNIVGENSVKNAINYDILKQVCDCEPYTCNPKYRAPREVYPVAKQIFALNTMPPQTDETVAWYERMIIVKAPKPLTREQINPNLMDEFAPELTAIAHWALRGLIRLVKNRGELTIPESVERERESYFESISSVGQFWTETKALLNAHHVKTGHPATEAVYDEDDGHDVVRLRAQYVAASSTYNVRTSDAYATYNAWCGANGYKAKSKKNFNADTDRVAWIIRKSDGASRCWGLTGFIHSAPLPADPTAKRLTETFGGTLEALDD